MIKTIQKHRQDFDSRIGSTSAPEPLKQLRIDFLGKKGCVQALMKKLREAAPEEKRELANSSTISKNTWKPSWKKKMAGLTQVAN